MRRRAELAIRQAALIKEVELKESATQIGLIRDLTLTEIEAASGGVAPFVFGVITADLALQAVWHSYLRFQLR